MPVRSAIAATALAVTALAATMTFGTNLARLVGTPRRYGQSWDIAADAQFSPLPAAQAASILRAQPGVAAWTFGVHDDVTVDGQDVPTVGLTSARGRLLAPTLVEGRAADGPTEIVLGTKTLDHLHRRVGQTVVVGFQIEGSGKPRSGHMRIVGRAVFPFFGEGSFTPTGLGVGAQIAGPHNLGAQRGPPANLVLVSVAPGADHEARVAQLARDLGRAPICGTFNQCSVTTKDRPADILNYSRVQGTPFALSIVLALLAIILVANLLFSSNRRRRRDSAILRALGFERRQISAAIAWQATTVVAIALAVGLPLGTALGRWIWATFALNLGVPGQPTVPLLAFAVVAPVAIVIGNLIAAVPGFFARRTSPAAALRTE